MKTEQSSIVCYSVRITGRVQGVGFRYSAINKAKKLSVNGFVKNLPDGSVYIEMEGSRTNVDQMLAWCYRGPGTAWVDKVQEFQESVKGYRDFRVKY